MWRRETERQRDRDRETERQRDRETERQRDRERETEGTEWQRWLLLQQQVLGMVAVRTTVSP